jgi:hypothetical protein
MEWLERVMLIWHKFKGLLEQGGEDEFVTNKHKDESKGKRRTFKL